MSNRKLPRRSLSTLTVMVMLLLWIHEGKGFLGVKEGGGVHETKERDGIQAGMEGEREHGVLEEQCVGTDGCKCTFDDGSVIDISGLGNTDGTPRFHDVKPDQDDHLYAFNPCYPFSLMSCKKASMCQLTGDKSFSYQTGDADTASWSFDGTDLKLFYSSDTDTYRESYITFKCDESATTPVVVALGETATTLYEMTVTTKCACKNGCVGGGGGSSPSTEGLSPGSILLIIVFAMLLVYIAGGMVFNKTRRQAQGMDIVPNIAFWRQLPGFTKDGCTFVISKLRGNRGSYSEL